MSKGIHPIDYRYGSKEIRNIFQREKWLEYMKKTEFLLLKALVDKGVIKEKIDLNELWKRFEEVSLKDVLKRETITKHETMAVVMALSEKAGEYGKYIHVGATSNDILDCVLALQINDAHEIIIRKLEQLIHTLINRASEEKRTPILGRTHGRAAIPITYGFKFALFIEELIRTHNTINFTFKQVYVGKLGGAVGSQVELYPKSLEIEEAFLSYLGLRKADFYTQVIPRDRLANYLLTLITLSSILDQIGNEIRNLQRSEIEEVFEPFAEGQVGSSVMPHKRNPINSEKVCGLAKVLRGYSIGILENIVLEHERDLTNSSFERTVIPEIFILLDEQLNTLNRVFNNLIINRKKAHENIVKQEPFIYSDLILHKATFNGADRQKAHKILREILTRYSNLDKEELIVSILGNQYLSKYLTEKDLEEAMDLNRYIDAAEAKVNNLLNKLKPGDFSQL